MKGDLHIKDAKKNIASDVKCSERRIVIFDTTLRDGEQSPGASMTREEKIRVARQLERLGVDVIEAGFPASSPGDFQAVQEIAKTIRNSRICGLCRAVESDILCAVDALKVAERFRIHTFIATSSIHMEKKLRMTPDQVIERAIRAVRLAKRFTDDVEFSAEDASRSSMDFLCRIVEAVIDAGATTINLPDTVGYAIPEEYGDLFFKLKSTIPNADKAIFSVHCHDDLGLAAANALSGVTIGGAGQIECTINGLGERAGNTALEEIVMAMTTRRNSLGLHTGINLKQIVPTSKLVTQITGFNVQANKAVVGANAFAHASGIHQDGIIKARETYEIMTAEDVGWDTNRLVLGKLSGRNAVKQKLHELGIFVQNDSEMDDYFSRFKALADRKNEIFDEDLLALIVQNETDSSSSIDFVSLKHQSKTGSQSHAEVVLRRHDDFFTINAHGNGPVDAVFNALEKTLNSGSNLILYSINAITGGTEAQGEVTVRLQRNGRLANGMGTDPDIVAASAKAYIDALNRLDRLERTLKRISVVD